MGAQIENHTLKVGATRRGTAGRTWRFVRQYVEILIAISVGMFTLVPVTGFLKGITGLDAVALLQTPEALALEMAFNMSVGMVVWLRIRGHGWAGTLEMAGSMFAAAVVFFPPLWLGFISGETLMLLMHVAMLPLMLLVMLRRRQEYSGH